MKIDNRAFYRKLRTLAAPITFQSFMLAAVAAADALMLGGVAHVSAAQIRDLVDEIETEIFCNEDKEVGSDTIGELIMDKLKDLDPVAYVRFASVYREFKDVNTFMDELKKMLN